MLANGIKHLEARIIGDKNFVNFTCDEKLYLNELQQHVATSRRKENVKTVVTDTSVSYSGAK